MHDGEEVEPLSTARLGPPGGESHGCSLCHYSEAHRFAATLRDMAEVVARARH